MGALVGATFATGTTLPEMDVILKEITTELLFKENPPREELSMRRKSDDYNLGYGRVADGNDSFYFYLGRQY